MTFLFGINKMIAAALVFLISLFYPAAQVAPYAEEAGKDAKVSFSVVSDCHVEGNNFATFKVFRQLLTGLKADSTSDAIVFLGDNTMNGQNIESMFFYGLIDDVDPCDNILVALGNHDVGNGEGNYDRLLSRFLNFNNTYFDAGLTTPYYYRVIEGCYFIVLATDSSTSNTMDFSNEQYKWLEGVLAQAKESGNPIFVFNHHPIFALEGEDDRRLYNLLDGCDNLIYFYGHTHREFSENSYAMLGDMLTVSLPRTTENAVEGYETGVGVKVFVYEDEVVVTAANFCTGTLHEALTVSVPIE